ncbi:MAG: diacylglycerol/lipid kinase family protein [Acidimicrobiia bacterium]
MTTGARRIAAILSMLLCTLGVLAVGFVLIDHLLALVVALAGLAVAVVGVWWLVTERGVLLYLSPIPLVSGLVLFSFAIVMSLGDNDPALRRAIILVGLIGSAVLLARLSLSAPSSSGSSHEDSAQVPKHPVLLCNPWSGGGKVASFGLVDLAESLGVEVVMLEKGLDLEELTRDAVERGADCLGMAGGDGSQALVASVAVEHGLPFVCVPAGTRNHFALDLGLNRDDPREAMSAFGDAVERRVDYATVNGRLFVNNVSLGIYATTVQSDEYRDAKAEVSLSTARRRLGRQSEPFDLQYSTPDGQEIDGAFLIMVSNNPYVLDANPYLAQRDVLDSGRLGVFAISTRTGSQAAWLMTLSALGMRDVSKHWWEFDVTDFVVESRSGSAFLGVDGEALEEPTPLRFSIHHRGLRMLMPEGNLRIAEQRRARDRTFRRVLNVAMGNDPTHLNPA